MHAQDCNYSPDHIPRSVTGYLYQLGARDLFLLQGSKINTEKAINWWAGSRHLLFARQASQRAWVHTCRRTRVLMKQEDFKVGCRDTDVLCCHWTQTPWAVSCCSPLQTLCFSRTLRQCCLSHIHTFYLRSVKVEVCGKVGRWVGVMWDAKSCRCHHLLCRLSKPLQ